MGSRHEWHSVKPNTLGLKVLRTKTAARRPMINNMISISPYGKPCVSEAYSILFIYNSLTLILVRVERKSFIRKTLILIRVPFVPDTFSAPERRFSQGLETLAERNKFATKAVGIRGRSLATLQHARVTLANFSAASGGRSGPPGSHCPVPPRSSPRER